MKARYFSEMSTFKTKSDFQARFLLFFALKRFGKSGAKLSDHGVGACIQMTEIGRKSRGTAEHLFFRGRPFCLTSGTPGVFQEN